MPRVARPTASLTLIRRMPAGRRRAIVARSI